MKTALCSLGGVILALRSISLGKDVVVSPPLVSSVLPLIKLCALFTPFSAHQTKGLLDHFYSFLDNLHFINEYLKTQPSLACSRSLLRDKKKIKNKQTKNLKHARPEKLRLPSAENLCHPTHNQRPAQLLSIMENIYKPLTLQLWRHQSFPKLYLLSSIASQTIISFHRYLWSLHRVVHPSALQKAFSCPDFNLSKITRTLEKPKK